MPDALHTFGIEFLTDSVSQGLFFIAVSRQKLYLDKLMITERTVNLVFDIIREAFLCNGYNWLEVVADGS